MGKQGEVIDQPLGEQETWRDRTRPIVTRIAFVSGGMGGIGSAICRRLGQTGHTVIAGCLPHGLGAHLAHFEGEHDGTVAVAETRLPGISDHCVVEASHTGLLLSATAARQTIAFLRNGCFDT